VQAVFPPPFSCLLDDVFPPYVLPFGAITPLFLILPLPHFFLSSRKFILLHDVSVYDMRLHCGRMAWILAAVAHPS